MKLASITIPDLRAVRQDVPAERGWPGLASCQQSQLCAASVACRRILTAETGHPPGPPDSPPGADEAGDRRYTMSLHIANLRPAVGPVAGMWDIADIVDGDPDDTGATIDDWIGTWRANGWTVESDDSPRGLVHLRPHMVSRDGTYLRVREADDHRWQHVYAWED